MILQGLQLLVSLFGLAGVAKRAKQSAGALCATLAGALLCLVGAGFLLSAVRGFLARHFGFVGADVMIGANLALVGLVIILLVAVRRKSQSATAPVEAIVPAALGAVSGATRALNVRLRKSVGSKPHGGVKAAVIVTAAGFLLARVLRRQ